ncbi:MAG: hypothetical protein E7186_01835 [Erysipelotrichaceae bacterium]|nr:hypothetical protein [Erysipelotrichaceae bacterium]
MEEITLKCLNTQPYLCKNINCPRHGRCCECVAHHRAMGKAPNCYKESGIILVPQQEDNQ